MPVTVHHDEAAVSAQTYLLRVCQTPALLVSRLEAPPSLQSGLQPNFKVAGWLAIILHQLARQQHYMVPMHGRVVLNWQFSRMCSFPDRDLSSKAHSAGLPVAPRASVQTRANHFQHIANRARQIRVPIGGMRGLACHSGNH